MKSDMLNDLNFHRKLVYLRKKEIMQSIKSVCDDLDDPDHAESILMDAEIYFRYERARQVILKTSMSSLSKCTDDEIKEICEKVKGSNVL